MTENMRIWDAVKRPPPEALKTINGGRLSGMTDVKPQWRYQAVTELFGPCGIGWKFEIVRLWTEPGSDGQVLAFAHINLFIPGNENKWAVPIPGIGGSMLITKESKGLHNSDEAFKMAITDALSTAMKMLGVAADIYSGMWDGGKYKDAPITKLTNEPVDESKVSTAVEWFKKAIEIDNIEEHYKAIQDGWKKLSNNERMVVDSRLQEVVPGTKVKYKNALKKYLDYVPGESHAEI